MIYNYSYSENKWKENYKRAQVYYKKYESLYVPVSYVCEDGFKLGNWLSKQRTYYRKGILCQWKINLLDEINMIWDVASFSKSTSIPELIVFYYINCKYPDAVKLKRSDFLGEEIDVFIPSMKLGIEYDGVYWHKSADSIKKDERKNLICLNNQIKLIRIREKGLPKLNNCYKTYFVKPNDKIELEETIEKILLELTEENLKCDIDYDYKKILNLRKNYIDYHWNYVYSILEQKSKINGTLKIKKKEIDKSGINLYTWLNGQRQEFKNGLMTESHKRKLEKLGISLMPNEEKWYKGYKALIWYKNNYSDTNVKIDYVSPAGFNLGKWVAHQRENYRNEKLNEIYKNKLLSLGFIFNPNVDNDEYKKKLLLDYYENHGNINIPRNYIVKEINLFEWLQTKKKKYVQGLLKDDEIAFFNDLGVIWNKYEEQWNKAYEEAEKFYNENGHLIIPVKGTLSNGINLGIWISTQRCEYKQSKLSSIKINKLNQIGMCWSTYDYHWKEKYYLLCDYYKVFGHINLKCNEQYCGVKLGMWLSTQRQAYRGNPNYSITKERIELLEALNMEWEPMKKVKTTTSDRCLNEI